MQEPTRTPRTSAQLSELMAQKKRRAPASGAAVAPAKRSKAGGGGAGVPRPQRGDRERQRANKLEPAQTAALQAAADAYHNAELRLRACRTLRKDRRYDPVLPLSPPANTCVSPVCRCTASYRQLKNDLGLGSPSVVRRPLGPSRHSRPSRPASCPPPRPRTVLPWQRARRCTATVAAAGRAEHAAARVS